MRNFIWVVVTISVAVIVTAIVWGGKAPETAPATPPVPAPQPQPSSGPEVRPPPRPAEAGPAVVATSRPSRASSDKSEKMVKCLNVVEKEYRIEVSIPLGASIEEIEGVWEYETIKRKVKYRDLVLVIEGGHGIKGGNKLVGGIKIVYYLLDTKPQPGYGDTVVPEYTSEENIRILAMATWKSQKRR